MARLEGKAVVVARWVRRRLSRGTVRETSWEAIILASESIDVDGGGGTEIL